MKELLKKLMLDTVTKLKNKGLSETEAVDQVIGLVNLNKDSINDIIYMKTLLNNLVEIS
jgi:hypothetical protein